MSRHKISGHKMLGHRHKMSGHKMSGRKMSGHKISGHKMSGHKMSGHKMLGLKMSGHKVSGHKMSNTRCQDTRCQDTRCQDTRCQDTRCPGSISGGQGGRRLPGGRQRVPWVTRGPRGQEFGRGQLGKTIGLYEEPWGQEVIRGQVPTNTNSCITTLLVAIRGVYRRLQGGKEAARASRSLPGFVRNVSNYQQRMENCKYA